MSQQRAHYRVTYPVAARPHLVAWGGTHEVVDLAETGMRIVLAGEAAPEPGASFSGTVLLGDRDTVEITGRVVRVHERDVAAQLDQEHAIPFRVVLAEQRFLRAHYPGLG